MDDLVQTLFAILFADRGKLLRAFDPERGKSLEGYVALIADCRLASLMRTRRGRIWPDDPTDADILEASPSLQTAPDPPIHTREAVSLVMHRLRAVTTPKAHSLFVWLYVEERSPEEVATLSGLTVENVHTHKSRLGKLARKIATEVLSS